MSLAETINELSDYERAQCILNFKSDNELTEKEHLIMLRNSVPEVTFFFPEKFGLLNIECKMMVLPVKGQKIYIHGDGTKNPEYDYQIWNLASKNLMLRYWVVDNIGMSMYPPTSEKDKLCRPMPCPRFEVELKPVFYSEHWPILRKIGYYSLKARILDFFNK
jgi:hypothetical protein